LDASTMSVRELPFKDQDSRYKISNLAWSPNGEKITFVTEDSVLWQVDYPTLENLEHIMSSIFAIREVRWSPDSKSLAFINLDFRQRGIARFSMGVKSTLKTEHSSRFWSGETLEDWRKTWTAGQNNAFRATRGITSTFGQSRGCSNLANNSCEIPLDPGRGKRLCF